MKFRVETWDTTQKCAPYITVAEGSTKTWGWGSYFDTAMRTSPPTVWVRETVRKWWGWEFVRGAYGTKETKPMSTKQRGDVEKITPIGQDTFCVNLGGLGGTVSFARDEFRRIWEAGNREFADTPTHHQVVWLESEVERERERKATALRLVAEKGAEIARLKNDYEAALVQLSDAAKETVRRKSKVEAYDEIHKYLYRAHDVADKVPGKMGRNVWHVAVEQAELVPQLEEKNTLQEREIDRLIGEVEKLTGENQRLVRQIAECQKRS